MMWDIKKNKRPKNQPHRNSDRNNYLSLNLKSRCHGDEAGACSSASLLNLSTIPIFLGLPEH